ncbi:MAG: hypothetical protein QXO21_05880, partial [Candidatus Anstonellales archaeon]
MGQLETQTQGMPFTNQTPKGTESVPRPRSDTNRGTQTTVSRNIPKPNAQTQRRSIHEIRREFENTVLRNIADRILNYYENSKTADGKERAYKAMEIVEWMLKNLKNPNSINALKQFLEATFGDKQTKTENFQANSVLVGVLVYMFNDVNVLIKRQRELSSRENLYNNLLNKVKNFLNEFLPMIANNHELARKIGITVSVYDSKIGKVYSDGIAAMRNSLPLGLQNDQIIQELLKAQQVYYLRGEMDISFGQKLLYQAVTRLGLSSRYKEAIKNNNFSFFRRDYGDGNSIVEFDLMAATATITNQGPLGSNNTFKFNFENTRTY